MPHHAHLPSLYLIGLNIGCYHGQELICVNLDVPSPPFLLVRPLLPGCSFPLFLPALIPSSCHLLMAPTSWNIPCPSIDAPASSPAQPYFSPTRFLGALQCHSNCQIEQLLLWPPPGQIICLNWSGRLPFFYASTAFMQWNYSGGHFCEGNGAAVMSVEILSSLWHALFIEYSVLFGVCCFYPCNAVSLHCLLFAL